MKRLFHVFHSKIVFCIEAGHWVVTVICVWLEFAVAATHTYCTLGL